MRGMAVCIYVEEERCRRETRLMEDNKLLLTSIPLSSAELLYIYKVHLPTVC